MTIEELKEKKAKAEAEIQRIIAELNKCGVEVMGISLHLENTWSIGQGRVNLLRGVEINMSL